MLRARPLWESILSTQPHTTFQRFDLNMLAANAFAGREEPFIVCAEASFGAAIVPAAIRHDGSISLLGEELFDYRCFLHQGDPEVLRAALAAVAGLGRPLDVKAIREQDLPAAGSCLPSLPFCCAPSVRFGDTSAEEFALAHSRLGRNLRGLTQLGFTLRRYNGDYPGLVRFIYRKKAAQTPSSLFREPARIEFMVNGAGLLRHRCEIFTLEDEASIAAALVVLREDGCRRFYTGWFAPELEKHSPALSLIYEITRQSLAEGLDCDYMTGEQPYKLRLATASMPLYRVHVTAEQLAAFAQEPVAEITQAA
ncbi:MAG TPA: GNAT family N-acetyltransferase [Candidatus Angelobacter sp.]|nr:GNAT family N-acetyltransferase [Candidatus Angelobacter sp.]